jgi:hypothetical protein
MKYTYEEKLEQGIIIRTSESGEIAAIPINESNSDYQRYLRWLENPDAEEGGTL